MAITKGLHLKIGGITFTCIFLLSSCGTQPTPSTQITTPTNTIEATQTTTPILNLPNTNTPTPIPHTSTATSKPTHIPTLSLLEIAFNNLPQNLAPEVAKVIHNNAQILAIDENGNPIAYYVDGVWLERVLRNACFRIDDNPNEPDLLSSCSYLTPEMTSELREEDVRYLYQDDGSGNLIPLADGRVPSLDFEGSTDYSEFQHAFTICTVRGAFVYPYTSYTEESALVYCVVDMLNGQSQGFFFYLDGFEGGFSYDVFFLDNSILPSNWDDMHIHGRIPQNLLYDLFLSGITNGQQIGLLLNLHDTANHENMNKYYAQIIGAIEDREAVQMEDSLPMNLIWLVLPKEYLADLKE